MDERVIIYPDKIIWVYQNDEGDFKYYLIRTEVEFQRILRCMVDIQPWVTIGDLMNLLSNYSDFIEENYYDVLAGFEFKPYVEDTFSGETYKNYCDFVEFYHNVDVYKIREDSNQLEWNNWGSVRGVKTIYDKNEPELNTISVSLEKIANFKNANIRINPSFEIPTDNWGAPPLLKTCKHWSLNEILETWLFEISYFGYPEERDQYYQDLLQGNQILL